MKIMIVEDEMRIAFALREMMQFYGHTVIGPFKGIAAAFESLASQTPDVALLDLCVSGGTTVELANALVADGVSVVFMSGNTQREADLPTSLDSVPYLEKPVAPQMLMATIDRAGKHD